MDVKLTRITESSHPSDLQSKSHNAKLTPHKDFDVTIIWNNIDARSDLLTFRKDSQGPVERILVDFARVLQSGVLGEVYSVNASKHLFCMTLACRKNEDEGVMDQILSVL